MHGYAEAGHRRLQNEFTYSHPTIWRFIRNLHKTQRSRDLDYTQAENGVPQPAKKRKYVTVHERIKTLVEEYDSRSYIEFLRAIAHNL